jgi:hypothetical protein
LHRLLILQLLCNVYVGAAFPLLTWEILFLLLQS